MITVGSRVRITTPKETYIAILEVYDVCKDRIRVKLRNGEIRYLSTIATKVEEYKL